MLKRIKFIRDTVYPNNRIDKKGVERNVTQRHAKWLIEIGAAEVINKESEEGIPAPQEVKEEKQPIQTKEEKQVKTRRTKKGK